MTDSKAQNLEDTLRMVQEVLTANRKDLRSLLYKDIILNSLKCKRDELDILDLKVINRAVAEFRHAACVFKPYRTVRKVSLFGSAREKRGRSVELYVILFSGITEHRKLTLTGEG